MKYISFFLILFSVSIYGEGPKLLVSQIGKNIYVHTSYKLLKDGYFPSNGLLIETGEGVVLVDTAWGEEQTFELLDWISNNLKKPVIAVIITHFHEDRAGGIDILKKQNIPSYAGKRTISILKEEGESVPEKVLKDKDLLVFGKTKIETFFPGAGHSKDNLVVWLPGSRILFGGCLVKSVEADDIGNTKDADLKEWPKTIRKLEKMFPKISIIVPGHQAWGGRESLKRTLELLGVSK
ncbi:subclass B1 metallo-beta-lactamase [Leptospira sp. WS58.C1]|uniref:subclass B1 metallo-beta-lactamase n=1 Tax=Leptospira TaxID=171 RepID=UPI00034AC42A|nr:MULTISPECIES: subclass B1 metallo-beta-lactamase [unclassified Leptospira]MCR1795387.1 subclass B1 metallo-beta-lactamase [Leptospira sp. id769339]